MAGWTNAAGRPPSQNRTRPVEVRECRRHGWTEHAYYRGGKAGPRWRCRTCVGEAVTRRHHKVRRILISEAGGCCTVCGYARCLINLHFHHVDPTKKAFALTSARGKGIEARREEAKKCVLVCANCHGEIESGLIPSPPPGARYGERWTPVAREDGPADGAAGRPAPEPQPLWNDGPTNA